MWLRCSEPSGANCRKEDLGGILALVMCKSSYTNMIPTRKVAVMRYQGIIVSVLCVGLLLTSCHQAAQVDKGPRLGRGVSVNCSMRQMPVSEKLDGPGHVLACLVWAERLREDVSAMDDVRKKGHSEDEQGKGISWDTSVGTTGAEFVLTQDTAEPPILIVMRGYSKGGSWGVQHSFLSREGPHILKARTELARGDEVWATYKVTAEPFTESFVLAGKEQGLEAGRVLLADFASEPVRVRQLDIGDRELAEARDALADDPRTLEDVQRQLRSTLRQLLNHNRTVREFVGDALALPSTP